MVPALDLLDSWDVPAAAAGVVRPSGEVATRGPAGQAFPLASVTKLLTATAVLVAVEEGSVSLDDDAGPPGASVRHLLAHASGLAPDTAEVIAAPGSRRIYSNAGFEALAHHVEDATGIPFAEYLAEAVLEPLGMGSTYLEGSPAHGAVSTVDDLMRFAGELLDPRVVAHATLREATDVAFPGLAGVLPGFGRQDPNDWGLGFELRDGKHPHWTGTGNSSATFGHFGRSGTFVWVDPVARLALVVLTSRDFGPWAAAAWPVLADAVLAEHAAR